MSSGLARRALWVLGLATLTILSATTSSAVDDEAWAVFDGKKDRTVEIRTTSNRVFVTGTNSDTVYVRARRTDLEEADEEPESDDPRAAGLRKITHRATGLEVWGEGNVVTVATRSYEGSFELYIRMPRDAALDIEAHFADSVFVRNIKASVDIGTNGSARLENVDGEIEVETEGGWIYLTDVAGSVVCNTGFGGIEGTVKRLDDDRPISLSALGPIDVAIPSNSKATLYLKTSFGEVYTDFDVELQRREGWSDDTGASIPFVTVLPPRMPKMAAPVVVVEPRPVKVTAPKPDKPDKRDNAEKPDKSDEAEKAEQEERLRNEYDEAVRAYLRAHREELRVDREKLRQQVREHRKEYSEQMFANREMQRVLREDLVGVAPYIVPTLTPGLIGEINGGGVEIRLTSMSGSIYVRRGK